MILQGNQRGGGKNLAHHLMKQENDLVEVHQLRGFASDNLYGAFQESYAISRATRCKQHLFSLSLNPPFEAKVSNEQFEAAIERAEDILGMNGQPRAIVFHEKRGTDGIVRRHAHAVWCRIDTEQMKAVQLSFSNRKLQDVSRLLYVEHGWKMPPGFLQPNQRNPQNFTLAEWQQAKRAGKDARALKILFQDCWAITDNRASFAYALKEHGLILAKGDRRGFVAVDHQGEVYPISRWVGVKIKQVRERLGEVENPPSIKEAHEIAAKLISNRLEELRQEQRQAADKQLKSARIRHQDQLNLQIAEQAGLKKQQVASQLEQKVVQQSRFRKGFFGLVDRFTGKHNHIKNQNHAETEKSIVQHRDQYKTLQANHTSMRKSIRRDTTAQLAWHQANDRELKQDIQWLNSSIAREEPPISSNQSANRQHRSRDGPDYER